MTFCVYIMASGPNGTLYVGSTDDLARRAYKHQERVRGGFTAKYDVTDLVWFEVHDTRETAFTRERQIKKWNRAWQLELIAQTNPTWRDLKPSLH